MRDPYDNPLDKVLERPQPESFEAWEQDRTRGVNAEPTEGFRDGVKSVKRMHPDHYIPNNCAR